MFLHIIVVYGLVSLHNVTWKVGLGFLFSILICVQVSTISCKVLGPKWRVNCPCHCRSVMDLTTILRQMRSLNNSTPISYIRRARHKYFQNCNGLKACARTIEVLLDYPIISTGLGQELFLGSEQRDQSPDACFSDRTGRTLKYDASGKKNLLKG